MENYNKDEIPFDVIEYNQSWMKEGSRIYSAKNSKLNKDEPSIFVIFPEIEYDRFESFEDLKKIPEEYSIWPQLSPNSFYVFCLTTLCSKSPTN